MVIFVVISLVVLYLVLKTLLVWCHTNCRSKVCLIGKTAVVTGGNSGIGYQIVLALAQRGCRVIIADKCANKNLLENIYEETHNRNAAYKYVDLASFKSVKEFAEGIIRDEGRLDILVNNAGVGRSLSVVTEDGLDMTMQVNYFSAFLLTRLLEDLLKKTGGRIIFTSSAMSYLHNFSLDQLKQKGADSVHFSYSNAKLCLIMASNVFAERLKKFGVTSNTYHPGLTAEEGAQTAIHLACANEVDNFTGKLYFETKITPKPKLARDKNLCHEVWTATEKIVELFVAD